MLASMNPPKVPVTERNQWVVHGLAWLRQTFCSKNILVFEPKQFLLFFYSFHYIFYFLKFSFFILFFSAQFWIARGERKRERRRITDALKMGKNSHLI
jgi:hypothetical protein